MQDNRDTALSFWLLIAFFAILWFGGGASRPDVLGQPIVRAAAWGLLVVAVVTLPRPTGSAIRAPALILACTVALVGSQLVPLPPSLFFSLPGRDVFAAVTDLVEGQESWRPLTISPSGTRNALAALVVPAVVLLLASQLGRRHSAALIPILLGMVLMAATLGLIQFAGVDLTSPFVNAVPGSVSGNFANRNHFALFLALGCVLSFAWAFNGQTKYWKSLAAICFCFAFVLMILATGSRMGLLLGAVGVTLSALMVREDALRQLAALPRATLIRVSMALIASFAGILWLSLDRGRAVSLDRAIETDFSDNTRWSLWEVVVDMIQRYAPVGSGFGTFDPVFRISEPDAMLRPQYYNQAHNDWLQIILEGGLGGVIVLTGAISWFFWRSWHVWRVEIRPSSGRQSSAGRAGSIIIVLVMVASVTDYPSRTPMIMALLAVAATWLATDAAARIRNS